MKNTFKIFGIIAMVAVIGFSVVGCSTNYKTAEKGMVKSLGLPVKDVEILGVVRVQAIETKTGVDGEGITYDALLREAEKLGGNGIINIMIDKQVQQTKFIIFTLKDSTTWFGSALAVRYTNENLSADIPTTNSGENIKSSGTGGLLGGLF